MMSSFDGTLNWTQFETSADKLWQMSSLIGDNWMKRQISTSTPMANTDSEPSRRIFNQRDVELWLKCDGYKDYLNFIKQLNEFAKGVHERGLNRREFVKNEVLVAIVALIDRLSQLVDEVKPIEDDKNQRFGNKAFRTWMTQMKTEVDTKLNAMFGDKDATELRPYLLDSFGNEQRIDYGTGHEMCFVIFLMGLYKLKLMNSPQDSLQKEVVRRLSHELLTIFAVVYLPLVRKIQLRYRLEPAGSHGVFSLDDFQFLPFYFGSAQLIGHSHVDPQSFPNQEVALKYKDDLMFMSAINFIHEVKRGPFAEHSNQLWNISGVDDWTKINRGLLNMYCNEYVTKLPIVQHLVFGSRIFIFNNINN
ncbi:serine/threonine-protein phosphatase 2A activator-like [Oppia nitens]|uniref:serine/threonine-protein phosphatase 2A activator-like n=1 Tax=Oppia nitens TaxID=1686743 RepID=UPI0023DC6B56|nr:serine/threonine-protein phosphatase 2A activator-like [Oppia nitens]